MRLKILHTAEKTNESKQWSDKHLESFQQVVVFFILWFLFLGKNLRSIQKPAEVQKRRIRKLYLKYPENPQYQSWNIIRNSTARPPRHKLCEVWEWLSWEDDRSHCDVIVSVLTRLRLTDALKSRQIRNQPRKSSAPQRKPTYQWQHRHSGSLGLLLLHPFHWTAPSHHTAKYHPVLPIWAIMVNNSKVIISSVKKSYSASVIWEVKY